MYQRGGTPLGPEKPTRKGLRVDSRARVENLTPKWVLLSRCAIHKSTPICKQIRGS